MCMNPDTTRPVVSSAVSSISRSCLHPFTCCVLGSKQHLTVLSTSLAEEARQAQPSTVILVS